MSVLHRLGIQGIRSFGAEETEIGIIDFFTPVTLILGPNGTGKTTIIESLKYITTGELPPGAKRDAAFIHDPKLTKDFEVKAKIALQFTDLTGSRLTANRVLTGGQLAKRVEMKTIDCVISRRNKQGQKVSMSNKCADMDREMVALMGISKAVLENVIFCHQEEANWPLGEGKQLKQKFDDLFASTRYVKALDAIRKVKISQNSVLSQHKIELKYLCEKKNNESRVMSNLREYEGDLDTLVTRMAAIKEDLDPVKAKLIKLTNESEKITSISTKIEVLRTKTKEIEKNQKQLRASISEHLKTATKEELQEKLDNFTKELINLKSTMDEEIAKLNEYTVKSQKCEKEIQRTRDMLSRHKHDAENHSKLAEKRDGEIRRLQEKFDLPTSSGYDDDIEPRGFIELLSDAISDVDAKLSETKCNFDQLDVQLQAKLDEKRKEIASQDTVVRISTTQMADTKTSIMKLDREIRDIDKSVEEVDKVKTDIQLMESKLEKLKQGFDETEAREMISLKEREKTKLESKRNKLDQLVTSLSMNASCHTLVDNHRKELAIKQDNYDQIMCMSEDDISSLIGTCKTQEMMNCLDKAFKTSTIKLNETQSRLKIHSKKLITMQADSKSNNKVLEDRQRDLTKNKQKISKATGDRDYNSYVVEQKSKLDDIQSQVGYLEGTEKVFIRYKKELADDADAACPLCQRCFDSKDEIRQLIEDIDERMAAIPQRKKKSAVELKENKKVVESLLTLKSVHDSAIKLEENEIPNLQTTQQNLDESIAESKTKVSSMESEVSTLEKRLEQLRTLRPEVNNLVRLQNEIQALQTKIDKETSKISSHIDNSRSLEEVTDEKSNVSKEITRLSDIVEKMNFDLRQKCTDINDFTSRVNSLTQRRLQAEKGMQNRLAIDQKKHDLERAAAECLEKLNNAKEKISPIKEELAELINKKREISVSNNSTVKSLRDKRSGINEGKAVFLSIQKEVEKFDEAEHETKTLQCEEQWQEYKEKLLRLQKKQESLSSRIEKDKKILNSQKSEKRNIEDNILLLSRDEEAKAAALEITCLTSELGGLDGQAFAKQRQSLERKYSELKEESICNEEKQSSLGRSIKDSKCQLKGDLCDARKNYNDKIIDIKTTEIAQTDLEKYYVALDSTIMHFHKQKMDTINKIIRELWVKTYRGNDIEGIEVRFDEGDSEMKARKVYNYRVVMIKQKGIELDMRGRCSTGQKVLASLIIRLALAETFCINCGIMALDEPTTNLDRDNIESLAQSLVNIIKSRQKQSNFQLIVITHDPEFVNLLGQHNQIELFYSISKNHNGNSRISKSRISDLM